MVRLCPPYRRPGHWLAWLLLLVVLRAAHAAPAHLELDISLDPERRSIRVGATLTATEGTPDFRLHPRFAISSASVDGRPVAVADLRRLPPTAGTPRRYAVEYAGTLPPLPDGLQRQSPNPAALYATPDGTYLAPEARWYPDPGAAFSYTVRLSLPAGQKGLVPGRQTGAQEAGGRWVADYAFEHPAEGIWLMAGPYQLAEQRTALDDGTPVTVRTWFHPELAELAPGYLQDSARYLQRYSRQIGAYPFGDFSVVSSPLPHGLGMPSLTYLGRDVLRLPFIRATSLGHEVLHNWWGNGVMPDWASGNWSEGLTTFMADYAYREDQGQAASREMRLQWLRDLAAVAPAHETALAAFTARQHGISSVIGYGKSAMVFLMLRDELGQPAFEQGLRALWRQYRFRAAGWKDLEQVFAQASGRDLSRFFAQWTRRAASPGLALARVDTAGRFRVTQAGEPFDLLVALRLRLATGEAREATVRLRDRETLVDAAALGAPGATAVELDPDLRLWRRLDPASVPPILRDAFIAPRAQLHVAAAGDDWLAPAVALAGRLLDAQAPRVPQDALLSSPDVPALVIGDRAGIDGVLARLGLAGVPPALLQERASGAALPPRASARAWVARSGTGKTLLFVVADTPAAVASLQRAMPHYGRQSWLVFEDGRVAAQGAWPAAVQRLELR